MRQLRILQLDSGGEKYLPVAQSLANKGRDYQIQHVVLPDAELYVHCFQGWAAVRIVVSADYGYLIRTVDADNSASWVSAEVAGAGSSGTPAENQIELPFGELVSVSQAGAVVSAEVIYQPGGANELQWTKVVGIEAASRPGTVVTSGPYTLTPGSASGSTFWQTGWDGIPLGDSTHASVGVLLWKEVAGDLHLEWGSALRTDGTVTGSTYDAVTGSIPAALAGAVATFDTTVVQLYQDILVVLGVNAVFATPSSGVHDLMTADYPVYLAAVVASATQGWAWWATTSEFRVYNLTGSGSSLEFSQAADLTAPASAVWIPHRYSGSVVALVPVLDGGDETAFLVDLPAVGSGTTVQLTEKISVTSIIHISGDVVAIVGVPFGESTAWIRTVSKATGDTIDSVEFPDAVASVLDKYSGGLVYLHSYEAGGLVWTKIPCTDAGVLGTASVAGHGLGISDASVGFGWPL